MIRRRLARLFTALGRTFTRWGDAQATRVSAIEAREAARQCETEQQRQARRDTQQIEDLIADVRWRGRNRVGSPLYRDR